MWPTFLESTKKMYKGKKGNENKIDHIKRKNGTTLSRG